MFPLKKIKSKQWLPLLATVLLLTVIIAVQKKDSKIHSSQLNTSPIETHEKKFKYVGSQFNTIKENATPKRNIVKTYQGTQPDGAIHLDENGNVIIDKDMKQLFDYYLSAMGELPLDQIRKYLKKFSGEQLNPGQLQQLLDYFDQYQNYLTQAGSFSHSMDENLSLQEKMKLLSGFRTDKLGSTMANAFFADEQAYIEFVITDNNNNELGEQQQGWLLAENQATEFQDVVIENHKFKNAENTNSSEVYQYRAEKYGQEAAIRLGQLDQHRAQWQTIVDDYFEQRQQIENQQSALSVEQLNSNYSTQETRRLEALWHIGTR